MDLPSSLGTTVSALRVCDTLTFLFEGRRVGRLETHRQILEAACAPTCTSLPLEKMVLLNKTVAPCRLVLGASGPYGFNNAQIKGLLMQGVRPAHAADMA